MIWALLVTTFPVTQFSGASSLNEKTITGPELFSPVEKFILKRRCRIKTTVRFESVDIRVKLLYHLNIGSSLNNMYTFFESWRVPQNME
jgi:hypothetical protein